MRFEKLRKIDTIGLYCFIHLVPFIECSRYTKRIVKESWLVMTTNKSTDTTNAQLQGVLIC